MSWKVQFRETRRNNHHQSHVLDSLNRKQTVAKETALIEAVEWCKLNGHRVWKVILVCFMEFKIPKQLTSDWME